MTGYVMLIIYCSSEVCCSYIVRSFGEAIALGGAILADGGISDVASEGSGSGGAVCLEAETVTVLGKLSAIGGTSNSASSGNGGGGRGTLKYCSLTESEFTEVDCHGDRKSTRLNSSH